MLEPLGAFPQEAELHIAAVVRESDALSVTVRTTASTATCPSCQQICGRVQSRYIRHVDDLPCSGLAVHLQVQVRRFRCLNARCARRIFSERVALLAEPDARRTTRLCDVVRHLGKTVGDAVERLVRRERVQVRPPAPDPPPAAGPPREPQARAAYRQAQFDEVLRRQADGMSLHQITRAVGVSRNTVRRYVRLRTCPGHAPRPKRHSRLDPYQDYLRLRWQEGCHNGRHLFRELQARGSRGGVSIVAHLVAPWRTALPPVPPHSPVPLTPRAVRWLLVRRPDDLNDEQRAQLNHLLQLPNAGTLVLAHRLIQRFVQLVDDRRPSRLTAWPEEATRCGISELAGLAAGIRRDEAAVPAPLGSPWSNGPTEGPINRLQLLKRLMYDIVGELA